MQTFTSLIDKYILYNCAENATLYLTNMCHYSANQTLEKIFNTWKFEPPQFSHYVIPMYDPNPINVYNYQSNNGNTVGTEA